MFRLGSLIALACFGLAGAALLSNKSSRKKAVAFKDRTKPKRNRFVLVTPADALTFHAQLSLN
jgi:hypothetical protein